MKRRPLVLLTPLALVVPATANESMATDEPEDVTAEDLAEGAVDPDEVDPSFEPWDEGADDE